MDLKNFKSGIYKQQFQFKSLCPSLINHIWFWSDPKLTTLLAEASLKLGELNAFSLYVPDIDIFIRMHVIKEATTSSRIEGTKTDVEEALLNESEVLHFSRCRFHSKENWNKMPAASCATNKTPLTEELIRLLHALVEKGARAKPTPYRDGQNVVRDSASGGLVYLPPEAKDVPALMAALVSWVNRTEIDEAAWAALYSTKSRPFNSPKTGEIKVKGLNQHGDEGVKYLDNQYAARDSKKTKSTENQLQCFLGPVGKKNVL